MQTALHFAPSFIPIFTPTKPLVFPNKAIPRLKTSPCFFVKATTGAFEPSTVDYSSTSSIFPAEACETIGGEACDADMYPQVKLKPDIQNKGVFRRGL